MASLFWPGSGILCGGRFETSPESIARTLNNIKYISALFAAVALILAIVWIGFATFYQSIRLVYTGIILQKLAGLTKE